MLFLLQPSISWLVFVPQHRPSRPVFCHRTIQKQYIMTKHTYQFTSESVSAGHPDKVADQISDAILDAYLTQDPNAKVACECLITTGLLLIAGEVTSTAKVDHTAIAQSVLDRIGYNNDAVGFNHHTAEIRNVIHTQSPEIFNSVVDGGAGDQGIMFGHACNDTPELMPLAITLSHQIVQKLEHLRNDNTLPWLRPDAKSQVTVTYDENGLVSVDKVVVSTQHSEDISQAELHAAVIHHALEPILRDWIKIKQPEYLINPSGSFLIGGPHGDTGLTGRKIVVDTYGGSCPHGGGAFSGKDPSKVDRSAAYAARYIAKHLVASGVVSKCNVQLSYAIGVSEPTSIHIESFGTHRCDLKLLEKAIYDLFPVQPLNIIEAFGLKRPIYQPTASYGHFGNAQYPWEVLDSAKIQALQAIAGINQTSV
jgi:S-adenosylmethionine synthetase